MLRWRPGSGIETAWYFRRRRLLNGVVERFAVEHGSG